ncbi:transmembrane protein 14A [Crotalus adamanteus]|uniref:Transmembrane protein 14A n=2 Tax=Crotalus adamanteus TaxID=8729 RepID=A0AAW1CA86_CROAD
MVLASFSHAVAGSLYCVQELGQPPTRSPKLGQRTRKAKSSGLRKGKRRFPLGGRGHSRDSARGREADRTASEEGFKARGGVSPYARLGAEGMPRDGGGGGGGGLWPEAPLWGEMQPRWSAQGGGGGSYRQELIASFLAALAPGLDQGDGSQLDAFKSRLTDCSTPGVCVVDGRLYKFVCVFVCVSVIYTLFTMSVDWIGFGYGLVVALGGIIGYIRKGSKISLVSGLFFGLLACYGAYWVTHDPKDVKISLFTAFTLTTIMGVRFKRTKKLMPAGIIAGLSLVMIVRLVFRLI